MNGERVSRRIQTDERVLANSAVTRRSCRPADCGRGRCGDAARGAAASPSLSWKPWKIAVGILLVESQGRQRRHGTAANQDDDLRGERRDQAEPDQLAGPLRQREVDRRERPTV